MKTTTTFFVPTKVGPSKLDQVLAYCVELSDEGKKKVCIIQDIVKMGKAMGHPPILPENFYAMYEMPVDIIERVQYSVQIEYNSWRYEQSKSGKIQGADF